MGKEGSGRSALIGAVMETFLGKDVVINGRTVRFESARECRDIFDADKLLEETVIAKDIHERAFNLLEHIKGNANPIDEAVFTVTAGDEFCGWTKFVNITGETRLPAERPLTCDDDFSGVLLVIPAADVMNFSADYAAALKGKLLGLNNKLFSKTHFVELAVTKFDEYSRETGEQDDAVAAEKGRELLNSVLDAAGTQNCGVHVVSAYNRYYLKTFDTDGKPLACPAIEPFNIIPMIRELILGASKVKYSQLSEQWVRLNNTLRSRSGMFGRNNRRGIMELEYTRGLLSVIPAVMEPCSAINKCFADEIGVTV